MKKNWKKENEKLFVMKHDTIEFSVELEGSPNWIVSSEELGEYYTLGYVVYGSEKQLLEDATKLVVKELRACVSLLINKLFEVNERLEGLDGKPRTFDGE